MEAKAEKLLRLLESENSEVVALTVFQLSEIAKSDPAVVFEPLTQCFSSKTWRVRFAAALTLTQAVKAGNYQSVDVDGEGMHRLTDVYCADCPIRKHPRVTNVNPLAPLLKFAMDNLFAKDWETTQGCLLCLRSLLETFKLAPRAAEHCLFSLLSIVAEDRLVDYEDDSPSYPVREVAAQVVESASKTISPDLIAEVLIHVGETAGNRVGALLALQKLRITQSSEALFRLVASR